MMAGLPSLTLEAVLPTGGRSMVAQPFLDFFSFHNFCQNIYLVL